ncbi:hypothetical protein F5H01DRAFT_316377 [Linnemannia elongata]|nr:hypothetical protein F5H01DRAFT_316377 [Linnemannia elongata]
MTIQDVHTNVQAVRRIYDTEESVNATTTPTSTMYLVSHPDPASGKDILLWDDILAAFKVDVVHVRSGAVVLPFLKGPDFKKSASHCYCPRSYFGRRRETSNERQ